MYVRHWNILCIAILCVTLISACESSNNDSATSTTENGNHEQEPTAVATPPNTLQLENGASSREELIENILTAFALNDTAALQKILITQEEFDLILFPELGMHYPAANDTRPETKRFLWENQFARSVKGLEKALKTLGGKTMEPLGIKHTDGKKEYRSYTMYEGTVVRIRQEDGEEADLMALGSIVEKNGVYKLLTFRDL